MEVLAEKFFTSTAVEAFTAELRVVSNDTIANAETLDLVTNCCNNTDGLMARNEGKL